MWKRKVPPLKIPNWSEVTRDDYKQVTVTRQMKKIYIYKYIAKKMYQEVI